MRTYDYIEKPDEKVVVCIMTVWNDDCPSRKFRFNGVAKCSPDDQFNLETGRKISQRRALTKFKKACIRANVTYYDRLVSKRNSLDEEIHKLSKSINNMRDTVVRLQTEIQELG